MNPHRNWTLPVAATLLALSLGACTKTPPPTASTPPAMVPVEVSDAAVTARVKTALLGEEGLKSFDIAVVTTNGNVRMTGVLDTTDQVERAKALVRSLDGVQGVNDELSVKK